MLCNMEINDFSFAFRHWGWRRSLKTFPTLVQFYLKPPTAQCKYPLFLSYRKLTEHDPASHNGITEGYFIMDGLAGCQSFVPTTSQTPNLKDSYIKRPFCVLRMTSNKTISQIFFLENLSLWRWSGLFLWGTLITLPISIPSITVEAN